MVKSSSLLLPGAVLLACAALIQQTAEGRLDAILARIGSPAATKPYGTFDAFWPHYMGEHSQMWTRRLHIIGTTLFVASLISNPALMLCVAAACAVGFSAFPFLRAQPSGAIEFALMLGTYLMLGKRATGSWRRTVVPMAVAYGFAWLGHYFIENNRPATFIYPSFSLIGDFRMLYEAVMSGKL